MSFESYVSHCGLATALAEQLRHNDFCRLVADYQQQLQQQVLLADAADTELQWSYRVPELGEGGACSLFGILDETPYDLAATLGGIHTESQRLVSQASAVVQFYRQHSRSHWFGVYQARTNLAGERVLVKLAYFGAESRAEFPLTAEFAQISNNSAVGLSGKGRIIHDVAAYVADGGEYYTCDPKVQAEACLPIFDAEGQVVGILDSEAFEPNFFQGHELALLLATAGVLAEVLA